MPSELRRKWGVLALLAVAALAAACGSGESEELEAHGDDTVSFARVFEETCDGRDNTVLRALKSPDGGERHCFLDEDCPQGSSCNPNTQLCDYECLTDGTGSELCAAGLTCGCNGKCQEPSDAGVQTLPTRLPTLRAEPLGVTFLEPVSGTWEPRYLTATLSAPRADSGTPVVPSVRVVAGDQLEVACSTSAPSFGSDCYLSGWQESPATLGEWRTRAQVAVRPKVGSTRQDWEVLFDSEGISGRRVRVIVSRTQVPSNPNVQVFAGSVTLSLDPYAQDGGNDTLSVPVRAWATATGLLLVDDSRTVSPTGRLYLPANDTARQPFTWLQSTNDGGTALDDRMVAGLSGTYAGLGSNNLSGNLEIALPGPVDPATPVPDSGTGVTSATPLKGFYRLSRVVDTPVTTCTAQYECAIGEVCETNMGACVPGTNTWETASVSQPDNTITSEQRAAFTTAFGTTLKQAPASYGKPSWLLQQGVLCHQGTDSTESPASYAFQSAFADGGVLQYSGDVRCLNTTTNATHVPPVAHLFTQRDRYGDADTYKADALLAECINNVAATPVSSSATTLDQWFHTVLGSEERCLSKPRLFAALELANLDANSRDQRQAWHLMQQWIGVHSFIALQTQQENEVWDYLGGTQPSNTLAKALDQFESAWELLLDPKYARLMPSNDAARTCSLLNPDYRVTPKPIASWVQDVNDTTGAAVPTRGPWSNWHRENMTLVYRNTDAYSRCTENPSARLFDINYSPDGNYDIRRALTGYCNNTNSVAMQIARKLPDVSRTELAALTPAAGSLSSANPALTLVYTSQDDTSYTVSTPTSLQVPASKTELSSVHFLLNQKQGLYLKARYASVAVWDHTFGTQDIQNVLDNPGAYIDNPENDLTPVLGQGHHDQGVGLPVTIAEGLAAHLRLLSAELERVERDTVVRCTPGGQGTRAEVIARFGRTMRLAMTLEAMAHTAHERERVQCLPGTRSAQTYPWEARWQTALSEVQAVRNQLLEQVRGITSCQPFGIPDNEVPLSFDVSSDTTEPIARFFTSSNALLGAAKTDAENAVGALTQAQVAWGNMRQGELHQETVELQQQQRLDDIKRQYGRQFAEMCGLTDPGEQVFDMFASGQLSPETCFFDASKPACRADPLELERAIQPQQAQFALCVWNQLNGQVPESARLQGVYAQAAQEFAQVSLANSDNRKYVFHGSQRLFPATELYGWPFSMESIPPAAVTQAHEACVANPLFLTSYPLPTFKSLGKTLGKECYRGRLGESMLTILGAQQSLDVARSTWSDSQERFDLAEQRCIEIEIPFADQAAQLRTQHAETMDQLSAEKGRLERRINNVQTAGNVLNSLVSGIASGIIGGLINGGTAIVQNRLNDASIRLSERIANAERDHRDAVDALVTDVNKRRCFAEARANMVGIQTAALQVERAETDVQAASLSLENMERTMRQALNEGRRVLEVESQRTIPTLAHRFWLNDHIVATKQYFRRAKHTAYLYALALEHERQLSTTLKDQIAKATSPNALKLLINGYTNDGMACGGVPTNSVVVLKLRDDIMKLQDMPSTLPPSERRWLAGQRFAAQLTSPENAIYTQNGVYLGQGIRFVLPEDKIRPIVGSRAAERLWSVGINLVPGPGFLDSWTEGVKPAIQIRKRTIFQSHPCEGEGFVTSTSRPSYRLSFDKTYPEGETGLFTSANPQADINANPSLFEQSGAGARLSAELRARGLYGEYEVIFPKALLQSGFPLGSVDDVWLRLEMVSVANDGESFAPREPLQSEL